MPCISMYSEANAQFNKIEHFPVKSRCAQRFIFGVLTVMLLFLLSECRDFVPMQPANSFQKSWTHKLHAKLIVYSWYVYTYIGHVAHFEAVGHVLLFLFAFFLSSLYHLPSSISLASSLLSCRRSAHTPCFSLAWQHNFRA